MAEKSEKYNNIDGLRTVAAICIILMHVLANGNYKLNPIFSGVVGKFGIFVKLFFIISGFGMCCGYYEKFKNGRINLNNFYSKRYLKILPFFLLLLLFDIALSGFKFDSIVQGFCNATLMFGLFPKYDTTVIGVCWTLGAIFAFYLLFPFFVYMLWTKKRAWFFSVITVLISYVCAYRLNASGCNISLQMPYFVAGGGVTYLYRKEIAGFVNKHRVCAFFCMIIIVLTMCTLPDKICGIPIDIIKTLIMFSAVLAYFISFENKVLSNRVTRFISAISFEIYLAHMVFYRIFEKLNLIKIFKNDVISYIFASAMVIISVIVFSYIAKLILTKIEYFVVEYRSKKGLENG